MAPSATAPSSVDWNALSELAQSVRESESRASYVGEITTAIDRSLTLLRASRDWEGIIRLRTLFGFLGSGEAISLGAALGCLNDEAIIAARNLGKDAAAGRFLHEKGQALHRQGDHPGAIQAFNESCEHYKRAQMDFEARESHYMTALCYRALSNRQRAHTIVEDVLQATGNDPWRAHPLLVRSWLQQDEGDLEQTEATLREAIALLETTEGDGVSVGQSLADLGEVVGFEGRFDEANAIFDRALSIFARLSEPDPRQVARTLLKKAEVNMRRGELEQSKLLLRQAHLTIAEAQYYDLMWRIQLAMAQVDMQERNYFDFARHVRLALRYRRAIGLTDWALVKQYLARRRMGAGLPR